MTWAQITPWLSALAIAATLGGVLWPYFRAKNREAQDKSSDALAISQAHRIDVLEGERDDALRARDAAETRRREAEAKAKHYREIIERAINDRP